jgi:hypothetical protein
MNEKFAGKTDISVSYDKERLGTEALDRECYSWGDISKGVEKRGGGIKWFRANTHF